MSLSLTSRNLRSLNPAIDLGQAEGAFMHGLGFVLREEVMYDKLGP